jgi:alanine-glyoxylate transaminase/serine-glyoxylate transaminase/serine-pyruvate transaminase
MVKSPSFNNHHHSSPVHLASIFQTFETRKAPPTSYYASWSKWLPIMKAYESGTPAYFATPPTNLIYAFRTSLLDIVKNSSIQERFEKHRKAASRVKDTVKTLGLKQVSEEGFEANGMTAVSFLFLFARFFAFLLAYFFFI